MQRLVIEYANGLRQIQGLYLFATIANEIDGVEIDGVPTRLVLVRSTPRYVLYRVVDSV